jgi:sulfur carrier protein
MPAKEKSRSVSHDICSLLKSIIFFIATKQTCMDIYINSKLQQLPGDSRITDALSALGIATQKGIAIAVNNNVVPRDGWDTYALQPEDKVTLIKATQGG